LYLIWVRIFRVDVSFQLALTGAAVVIARVILVQQFERAVQSGGLGAGIVVVSFGTDDFENTRPDSVLS
jgi:hypothetical protein